MPERPLSPAAAAERVRSARGRLTVLPLRGRAAPGAVVRRLRATDDPSVFWGRWAAGGVLIAIRPVLRLDVTDPADAFDLLDAQPRLAEGADPTTEVVGGGWVACLGYSPDHTSVAFYDVVLRWQPAAGWSLASLGLRGREAATAAVVAHWRQLLNALDDDPPPAASDLAVSAQADQNQGRPVFAARGPAAATRTRYLATVEEAIGRISRGDFYQVNLCTRLHASDTRISGDAAYGLFATLTEQLQPDWAALVAGPARRGRRSLLLSCSPELFLRVRGREVATAPIKGTAPRTHAEHDASGLRASAKDAAENIMITDLMRNDLSRVCTPGTVRVASLLDVEAHPGVWHLVSTVHGELVAGTTMAQLLSATFPPGSVTGAPKSAAVRSIAELEPEARGAYTGAVGLFRPGPRADLCVAIRTFELDGDDLALGVGSGVTVDSVPIREWDECLQKAAPLVRAAGGTLDPALGVAPPPTPDHLLRQGVFESVLVVEGQARRLAAHLARLDRSCRELYQTAPPATLVAEITELLCSSSAPRAVLRILARPESGRVVAELSVTPLGVRAPAHALVQARRPGWSWRHKWTDRADLVAVEQAVAEQAAAGALPYFTADHPSGAGSLAETSRGNLFVRGRDGRWRTPPLDDSLLPGVTRRTVLDLLADLSTPVQIERVPRSDLAAATGVFWTSSLSGAVPVALVDQQRLPSCQDLTDELNRLLRLGD